MGVSRVCRNPMQNVTRVISNISTVMPGVWRRKASPSRKSAQKVFFTLGRAVFVVRHTSNMHEVVTTIVAISIISTVVIPKATMRNPAMAGESRY